jgi:1-pyrroline-5-carboxylate dehydrogenase
MEFKLTYATMFDPPEQLHAKFDAAVIKVKKNLGREYGMLINNEDILTGKKQLIHSPINREWLLAVMQSGDESHVISALKAARAAFPAWSRIPWQQRVRLLRKAAAIIESRLFELSAAMSLNVGKNRMESLGDVQETADLISYACDQMESNRGYVKEMGSDPLIGYEATNLSVLRPYGVWLVISPFNFPFALSGGPVGAALVSGNTVILKPASDTTWIVRLLVDCFRDAGLPDGVLNFITGPGSSLGKALSSCAVDGITFTGSQPVGSRLYREFSSCNWIRPVILELGGKNAVIVSRQANLEKAAAGIVRSAFGLQGQKCSAASRIFIEKPVYPELVSRLKSLTDGLVVGDPLERIVNLGPVINEAAQKEFQDYCREIASAGGKFLTGGNIRKDGLFAKGFFCEPTLVEALPLSHRLWRHEMFLPIACLSQVEDLDQAMQYANDVEYGLTAGFYGSEDEAGWFFDRIEAGVCYANRPQGATTGAWPGFQPFGGWKASGSSGKNAGGLYYLPLYMHEQIQTVVK